MYKSKYPSLINFLTNQEDLILLDSEIQNIENLIDKDVEKQLILSGFVVPKGTLCGCGAELIKDVVGIDYCGNTLCKHK